MSQYDYTGELTNIASDRLDFDIQTEIMRQAYQYAALDQQASEADASNAAKYAGLYVQGMLGSQQNAIQLLNILASQRGPKNAFVQQAVMHGLNAAGLSNAVDIIAGRAAAPRMQGAQAKPETTNMAEAIAQLMGGTAFTGGGQSLQSLAGNYQPAARVASAPRLPPPSRVPPPPVVPSNEYAPGLYVPGRLNVNPATLGRSVPAPTPVYTVGAAGELPGYASGGFNGAGWGTRDNPISRSVAASGGWATNPDGSLYFDENGQLVPKEGAVNGAEGDSAWLRDHPMPGYGKDGSDLARYWEDVRQHNLSTGHVYGFAPGEYDAAYTVGASQGGDPGGYQDPTANYGDVIDGQMYVGEDPNGYGDPNNWVDDPGASDGGAATGGVTRRPTIVGEDGPEKAIWTPSGTMIVPLTRPATGLMADMRRLGSGQMPMYRPGMASGGIIGGISLSPEQTNYLGAIRGAASSTNSPQNELYSSMDDNAFARYLATNDQSGWGDTARGWYSGRVAQDQGAGSGYWSPGENGRYNFTAGTGEGYTPSAPQMPLKDFLNGVRQSWMPSGNTDLIAATSLPDNEFLAYVAKNDPDRGQIAQQYLNQMGGNTGIGAYGDALPDPNKIVSRNWTKLPPESQQFLLGGYEAKGWSPSDVLYTVGQNLPGSYANKQTYALTRR